MCVSTKKIRGNTGGTKGGTLYYYTIVYNINIHKHNHIISYHQCSPCSPCSPPFLPCAIISNFNCISVSVNNADSDFINLGSIRDENRYQSTLNFIKFQNALSQDYRRIAGELGELGNKRFTVIDIVFPHALDFTRNGIHEKEKRAR